MPLPKPIRGIQLNKNHPLARGLVIAWLMNEGGGNKLFDLSNRLASDPFYGNTGWKTGPVGTCLEFDGSGDYVQQPKPANITAEKPVSAVIYVKSLNTSNLKAFLNIQGMSGQTAEQVLTCYFDPANNRIRAGHKQTASYGQDSSSLNAGNWHQYIITNAGGNIRPNIYVDGVLSDTGTGPAYSIYGSNVVQIAKGYDATYDGNCQISYFYIYDRVLTAREVLWLYREPFAMFERAGRGQLLSVAEVIWLAGSVGAQSATSAALKQLLPIVGSAPSQTQVSVLLSRTLTIGGSANSAAVLSALCKIIRDVSGVAAGTSEVAGLLKTVWHITVSIGGVAAVDGTLTLSAHLPWFTGSLEIERQWIREVLFNGISANAFNLGTTLTLGWFWVRVCGCSALYRGASMGEVDFTNILAVAAQDAREIQPPSYLFHNSNSACFYVVRRFNNCGYRECTLSAAVEVSIDAGGEVAKPRPNNIFSSKAEQMDGNKIRLVWFYCPLEQRSKPERFKIYWDNRSGQIDYENPIAIVTYDGRKYYNYETNALEAGRHLFAIRAEDAHGVENNSLAQSRIDLHISSPDSITILSAETI